MRRAGVLIRALRYGAVAGVCMVALVGCGGSSSHSASSESASTNSSSTTTASASCQTSTGLAAGGAFIGAYGNPKYWTASGIKLDFQAWVSGKQASWPGAPKTALCPQAREAAAAVVLSWAAQHQAKFAQSSTPEAGGKNIVSYLKSQGVSCGSQCGLRPGAESLAAEQNAANETRRLNQAAATLGAHCSAVDSAMVKLTDDIGVALKHPSSASRAVADQIAADAHNAISKLTALEAHLSASQRARLQDAVKALGVLDESGGDPTASVLGAGLALGYPALKSLPDLMGQVC